jgi:hypothetical protein
MNLPSFLQGVQAIYRSCAPDSSNIFEIPRICYAVPISTKHGENSGLRYALNCLVCRGCTGEMTTIDCITTHSSGSKMG